MTDTPDTPNGPDEAPRAAFPEMESFRPEAVADPAEYREATPPPAVSTATPWPPDEAPESTDSGDGSAASPPSPTRAEWRQLSDEVRRLAAQIAHGRA